MWYAEKNSWHDLDCVPVVTGFGNIWSLLSMQIRHKCHTPCKQVTLYKIVKVWWSKRDLKESKRLHIHLAITSHRLHVTHIISVWRHCDSAVTTQYYTGNRQNCDRNILCLIKITVMSVMFYWKRLVMHLKEVYKFCYSWNSVTTLKYFAIYFLPQTITYWNTFECPYKGVIYIWPL